MRHCMTTNVVARTIRSDYLTVETSAPQEKRGTRRKHSMLYILRNHNSLAIAWNGRAPQLQTVARWEVRDPRVPVLAKR